MKEIYRHRDHARVGLLVDLFESEGIAVLLRNRNLTMTGLSEIPIPEFYPNICILNEEDEQRALRILTEFLNAEKRPLGADWRCSSCGEMVPDSMDECWNCQATRL